MTSSSLTIPWQKPVNDDRPEILKWTIGHSRYEIVIHILEDMSMEAVLPHCLKVKNRIDAAVSTVAHRGPSYFRVISRTLSTVIQTIWEQVILDNTPDENEADFCQCIRDFIAAHSVPEDRYELAQQLRAPRKPRDLPVQTFYYRLRELNSYIEWLPGTEAVLNDGQLRQALHDGMPPSWRERFNNAGNSVASSTTAQVVRYFRSQEKQAIQKQNDNNATQKKASQAKKRSYSDSNDNSRSKKSAKPNYKSNKPSLQGNRVSDDAKCPVHPNMSHTWGQCNANAYNKNRKTGNSFDKNKSGKKTSNFAAEVDSSPDSDSNMEDINESEDSGVNEASHD